MILANVLAQVRLAVVWERKPMQIDKKHLLIYIESETK